MSRANRWAAFWGISLVLVGVAFLLQNFNLLPGGYIQWWPALVVAAGLWLLARGFAERRSGGLIGGVLLSAMGVFWLLQNLGRVDERLFAPVVLIALGVGLLLRSLFQADRVT